MIRALQGEELLLWLRLLNLGVDRQVITRLLLAGLAPEDILGASATRLRRLHGLTARQAEAIHAPVKDSRLATQADAMDRHGMELIPIGSASYPRNLFEMPTPPPALFAMGTLAEEDRLAVGMVGPRLATHYGVQMAERLARGFAPVLTVVSGAALGVDSTAHETVLEAGGRTIAVTGCGLDIDYPPGNAFLRRRIAEGGGALLSIFPPGTRPLPGNFPVRNHVLAGLSLAVIVVEASSRSGALVTARAAAEEGRPVYAVPGDVTRRNSEGSNNLLRQGAIACTCAQDVLQDLEGLLQGELAALEERRRKAAQANAQSPQPREEPLPATGSEGAEALLLREIQHAAISHDELIGRFVPERMTLGELSTALLMLEMNGKIRQLPGRIYNPA